jgi:hypothetical protein
VLDELGDAPLVVELVSALLLLALVPYGDANSLIEKSLLAQTLGEFVKAEDGLGEDFRVRFESYLGAALSGLSGLLQFCGRDAALVLLLVGLTLAPDFKSQPFGKKVDAGDAHAVQTAGDFVSVGIEFPAGVQLGHNDFRRALLLALVIVHGDAATVINDCNRIV